jgi:hypothetical protein
VYKNTPEIIISNCGVYLRTRYMKGRKELPPINNLIAKGQNKKRKKDEKKETLFEE